MRVIGTLALAGAGGDTQAPTVPQGLNVTAINAGRVDLTWNASTDNVGVDGYQIFRNGVPLTTSAATNHSDITVQPSTLYAYSVAAYDGAGNVSATSGEVSVTTPANAAPSWQAVPDQELIVGDAYLLDLNAYCTDADEDTIAYSIVSGTLPTGLALVGQAISGTPTVSGQVRAVTVRATDPFASIDATIDYETFDTDVTAPPVPTGLAATAAGASQINVSWDASADAAGSANEFVSGTLDYRLYRSTDGTNYSLRATVTAASYSDTGLSASTQYFYKVSARDVNLNESAQSSAASATTAASGVTTSVVRGVLNVESGAGGAARAYFKWTYPSTNTNGTRFHDLRTGKLYAGTTPGGSQLINGLDFSTTGQKVPQRCILTGLQPGTTVYIRVRAVNSVGVESADSGEYSAVAAVYVEPTRANTAVPGSKTITVSGEYRIDPGTVGPININTDNVYVTGLENDGVTKRKLVHSSGIHGFVLASGVSNVRIRGIDFDHASGSGDSIRRNGAITNCVFDENDFEMRSNAAIGSGGNARAMTGCEVYGNTAVCTYPGGHDDSIAMVSYASGFTAWNNDFTLVSSSGRCGMFGGCPGYEGFSNTFRTTGATANAGFHTAYGLVGTSGPQSAFIHDNLIEAGANAGTLRLINFDGEPGTANDALRHRAIWNTFTVTLSGSGGTCIRVRNPVGPVDIAFNTFNNCNSSVTAISHGNDENGGGSGTPYGGFFCGNVCVNFGSGRPLFFEGGQGWQLILQTWDNVWGGEQSGGNGDWYMNRDSLINGISKQQASDWRAHACTIGGSTTGVTISGSWVGSYNPLLLTPSAPSTPTAVIGIA
jgi:chitodextrinase